MKWLAAFLIAAVIDIVVTVLIILIGNFTIGYKEIMGHIGALAIGYVAAKCAFWIINKNTKER